MDGGRGLITREPGGARRTDLLELFFDLAAIATLTLTWGKVATEQSWTGIAQAPLALSTLWAVWVTTTSFTDLYSPQATGRSSNARSGSCSGPRCPESCGSSAA